LVEAIALADKHLVKAMLAGKRLKPSRRIYNGALVLEFNIERKAGCHGFHLVRHSGEARSA
jgi:hypothetical protein